jgi:hypothetical protein
MGASRERPRVQQAFGRSLAEEESLSFSARAGARVVEECSLRNICGLRRKAAAKAADSILVLARGYDDERATCNVADGIRRDP